MIETLKHIFLVGFTVINNFIFIYVSLSVLWYFVLFFVAAVNLRKTFGLEDKAPYRELLEVPPWHAWGSGSTPSGVGRGNGS